MADFRVFLARTPEKNLAHIQDKTKSRIETALSDLASNPVPVKNYDVSKITGTDSNYRIRIGQYRILYAVEWVSKEIRIYDIDRKKDSTYK